MTTTKLLLMAMLGNSVFVVAAAGQTPGKKLDPRQLTCGQKVLVDDQTCPAGQVLEISGSCFDVTPADGTRAKGIQYNCVRRK